MMAMAQKRRLVLAALLATSLLVWWHPFLETLALSLRNDEYTQILLILPIGVTLIFLSRQRLAECTGVSYGVPGAMLVIAMAAAAYVKLRSASLPGDIVLSISMASLVLFWIGSFALSFGKQALKCFAFPLFFLFGLVPLPRLALNAMIALLQGGTAWSAHGLFAVFGVPVVQSGFSLTVPGLTVEVARECSSIRSSSMLFVTALLLAHVLLRSPWRKALVVCLVIPISVAKNGLRVFVITMLGTKVDPGYLNGRLHHQGGILFFLLALLCIFGALAICSRADRQAQANLELARTETTGE